MAKSINYSNCAPAKVFKTRNDEKTTLNERVQFSKKKKQDTKKNFKFSALIEILRIEYNSKERNTKHKKKLKQENSTYTQHSHLNLSSQAFNLKIIKPLRPTANTSRTAAISRTRCFVIYNLIRM